MGAIQIKLLNFFSSRILKCFKGLYSSASETAQQIKMLGTNTEEPSLVLGIHMV